MPPIKSVWWEIFELDGTIWEVLNWKVALAFQDQGHSRFPAFPLPDPAAQSRM